MITSSVLGQYSCLKQVISNACVQFTFLDQPSLLDYIIISTCVLHFFLLFLKEIFLLASSLCKVFVGLSKFPDLGGDQVDQPILGACGGSMRSGRLVDTHILGPGSLAKEVVRDACVDFRSSLLDTIIVCVRHCFLLFFLDL
jgi:hypothetical protein